MQVDCIIVPGADGVWKRLEIKSSRGALVVEREGRLATSSFQERKSTAQLKEKSLLFDNYGPGLCAAMLREYDRSKGGKQEVTVCIGGSGAVASSLERLDAIEKVVAGKDLQFSRYRLTIQTLDIDLWVGLEGKVVLANVPVQKAVFVRKGFEELAAKTVEDPLLSKPSSEVSTRKDLMVPCRDGIKLATDVYLPQTEEKAPLSSGGLQAKSPHTSRRSSPTSRRRTRTTTFLMNTAPFT